MDEIDLAQRVAMIVTGAMIGSLCAVFVSPAETTRDARKRFVAGIGFSCCASPAAMRGLIRWGGVSPESILDMLFFSSCLIGITSWWVIHAIVKVAKARSETLVNAAVDRVAPTPPEPES